MHNFSTAKNATQHLYLKLHLKWYWEVVREFYIKYKILVIFLALLAAPSMSTLIQLICLPIKLILSTNPNLTALLCVLVSSYALGLSHKKVFNQNPWNTYLASLPISRLTKIISTVLILMMINSVFILGLILNAQQHLIKCAMLLAMIVTVECLAIYRDNHFDFKSLINHPIYIINVKLLMQSFTLNIIKLTLMMMLSFAGILLAKNSDIPHHLLQKFSLSILFFNAFIISTLVKPLFSSWSMYKNYLTALPLSSIKVIASIFVTTFICLLPFLILNSFTLENFTPLILLTAFAYFTFTFITQITFERFGLIVALLGMLIFIYFIN